MRAVQCICQEYRYLPWQGRLPHRRLAETVAARLGRLLLEAGPTRSANTWMRAASVSPYW